MMAVGIIVVPIVAIIHIGGIREMSAKVTAEDPLLITISGGRTLAVALGLIIGWLSVSFCVFGQPHVVTRMMAIKNPIEIKRAALLAVMWFSFTRTPYLREWPPGY